MEREYIKSEEESNHSDSESDSSYSDSEVRQKYCQPIDFRV